MPAWVSILTSVALFFAGAALAGFGRLTKSVSDMGTDIAVLKADNDTFWRVIGPHMSGIIRSPDHLNRDHLIDKLDEETLTYDEALLLNSMLGHALQTEPDNTRKVALAFKLAQTRRLLAKMDRKRPAKETPCLPSTQM